MKTDNELIAEFIGWTIIDETEHDPEFYESPNVLCNYEYFEGTRFHKHDELFFNTSWDWLMPVVERLEAQNGASAEIRQAYCYIVHHLTKTEFNFHAGSKLEAVYKAVVEFIKWYNEQKS